MREGSRRAVEIAVVNGSSKLYELGERLGFVERSSKKMSRGWHLSLRFFKQLKGEQ